MTEEMVPRVNRDDVLIGTCSREEAYRNGYIGRGSQIFVMDRGGRVLLQRRSSTKATWPKCWDVGVAETVRADESYEAAALRGLREEMGIEGGNVSLRQLAEPEYREYEYGQAAVNLFLCIYALSWGKPVRLADGEADVAVFVQLRDIDTLVLEHPSECTPWLVENWLRFRAQLI